MSEQESPKRTLRVKTLDILKVAGAAIGVATGAIAIYTFASPFFVSCPSLNFSGVWDLTTTVKSVEIDEHKGESGTVNEFSGVLSQDCKKVSGKLTKIRYKGKGTTNATRTHLYPKGVKFDGESVELSFDEEIPPHKDRFDVIVNLTRQDSDSDLHGTFFAVSGQISGPAHMRRSLE